MVGWYQCRGTFCMMLYLSHDFCIHVFLFVRFLQPRQLGGAHIISVRLKEGKSSFG